MYIWQVPPCPFPPSWLWHAFEHAAANCNVTAADTTTAMSASTGTAGFACRVVIDDVSDWNHQTKQVPIAVSVRGLRPRQRAANEVPRDYA